MKNALIPLLLIGMLLSVTLSVAAMNHMDEMGHSLCPFEVAGITKCVQVQGTLGFITSHLNALSKFFSTAPIDGFTSLILSLLLALATAVSLDKSGLFKLRPIPINQLRESFVPPKRNLFTDWFSLHENSPAFIEGRW